MNLLKLSLSALVVTSFSISAFAQDPHPFQSQTFLRLANKTMQVIDPQPGPYKEGCDIKGENCKLKIDHIVYIYDRPNPLPTTAARGTNYGIFGKQLITISAYGYLLNGGMLPAVPTITGGVYFIEPGTNLIVAIDSNGYFTKTVYTAGAIRLAGGNFFIDQTNKITSFKSSYNRLPDEFYSATYPKPVTDWQDMVLKNNVADFSQVVLAGGNFMVHQNGQITTVDSVTGYYDGPYTLKDANGVDTRPGIVGGNFFIAKDQQLYTVNSRGIFTAQWKEGKPFLVSGIPAVLGSSYWINADGSFFIVAADGSVHEKAVERTATGTFRLITKIDPKTLETK